MRAAEDGDERHGRQKVEIRAAEGADEGGRRRGRDMGDMGDIGYVR